LKRHNQGGAGGPRGSSITTTAHPTLAGFDKFNPNGSNDGLKYFQ